MEARVEEFRANLASYRLLLMVPALIDRGQYGGTLRLQRGAVTRTFCFQEGMLVFATSNEPKEHLAQVLANLGILEVTCAAAAFEAARGACAPLGTFLVERGFVDPARLQEAMEHKAKEAFFDCYAWESGELELLPSPPPMEGLALRLPLLDLHREGLARLREWRTFREVFPADDCTFRVHREMALEWRSGAEEPLLELAERGASLAELLACTPQGQLFAARRVLQLYRRGVVSPRVVRGHKVGEAPDLGHLMALVRTLLAEGRFEAAAAVAAQALERAPVPEACALYQEAEVRMALAVSDELLSLEGRLQFAALPNPVPKELTSDDLYLYSLLRSAESVRAALVQAAMGELAAWRSVRRLAVCRLLWVTHGRLPGARRATDPYGIPARA